MKQQQPWIMIESKGEIEMEALNLIGASTKNETKIGYFGTGLKYSVAWLLRNGVEFHLFSGEQRISISTEPVTFRDQSFERIYINNVPTSMTTDMAKDWQPWFIIREIYSNALDEGEAILEEATLLEGKKDKTRIFVKNIYEFQYIVENFGHYFFDYDVPLIANMNSGQIFEYCPRYTGFYRMGINVFAPDDNDQRLDAAFIYNSYNCSINEARVSYSSMRHVCIGDLVLDSENPYILREFLRYMHKKNTLESRIQPYEFCLDLVSYKILPSVWEEALKDWIIFPENVDIGILDQDEIDKAFPVKNNRWNIITSKLDDSQYKIPRRMEEKDYILVDIEDWEKDIVNDQIAWFKNRGFGIDNYDIDVVSFVSPQIHGKALLDKNKILLGRKTLSTGISEVRKTLIEEYAHLKSKADDCTRSMQNALIDEIVTLLERQ